jgi:hypothetical protein
LGPEHDGLKAASTDFVDGCSIRSDRHACAEGDLSCRGLADASLYNIAEEDLFYGLRVNIGLFEGALEGKDAEFGCGEGLEGTIQGTDGGARSSDNDNFVRAVIRLFMEHRETGIEGEVWESVPLSG